MLIPYEGGWTGWKEGLGTSSCLLTSHFVYGIYLISLKWCRLFVWSDHFCNSVRVQVAAEYCKDTTLLLMGVICLAASIEKWNLHKRIALRMVMIAGAKPGMWASHFCTFKHYNDGKCSQNVFFPPHKSIKWPPSCAGWYWASCAAPYFSPCGSATHPPQPWWCP